MLWQRVIGYGRPAQNGKRSPLGCALRSLLDDPTIDMTRTVHITEPGDFKALIVRCRKCKTDITLPLTVSRPGIECPNCKTTLHLAEAVDAARAIRCLQDTKRDDCDIEFETAEPA